MTRAIDKAVDAVAAQFTSAGIYASPGFAYRLARAAIRAWLSDVPPETRESLPSYTIPSAADISAAEVRAVSLGLERKDDAP